MAKTLLTAVNDALKRVSLIQGDNQELSTLTSSSRQTEIDIMVQAWNEVLQELLIADLISQEAKEGSITLVDGQREYDLPSDFEGFAVDVLQNESDGHYVYPFPGGYEAMVKSQPQPDNHTGQPNHYVINPENGKLRLDTHATSNDAGEVYRFTYTQRHYLTGDSDTFPVSDGVVNHLMPAVKEIWNRERKESFDSGEYRRALARAANFARKEPMRKKY